VTSKQRNGGEWTEARFKSFVTSALRAASRRWPPKYKALKAAFAGRQVNAKTGKLAMHYKCAKCKKLFVAADVQADHVKPVVDPAKGFVSWDVFIDRLFCEIENFQILCRNCHKDKTSNEKKQRNKK
jgi:5-methylcytosine-specific restriction endonuclease McrA